MDTLIETALVLAAVGLAGAWATRRSREWSRRRAWLDRPNQRSSHAVPVPRLGGLGVVAATYLGWLVLRWLVGAPVHVMPIWPLALGAGIAAIIGLTDDLLSHRPLEKFGGQCLSVLPLLAFSGIPWAELPLWAELGLVTLWVVGFTNLFNFMDGSDGLAAGTAVVNGAALAALAPLANDSSWLALVVAAASAGFLWFNYAPASVFMGDVGSLFLGYCLAVLALRLVEGGLTPLAPIIALSPFLFDTSLTLVRRALRGERLWEAHRSHIYQRLIIAGWTHRRVAHLYYAWASIAGGLAWICAATQGPARALAVAGSVVMPLVVLATVARAEGRSAAPSPAPGTR